MPDRCSVRATTGASAPEGVRATHPADAGATTSDPAKAKTSDQILADEVWQGLGELRRPAPGLFFAGLSGGLDVGFSAFFMAVALTLLEPGTSPLLTRVVLGNMYATGFIFVILGRSEIFTEHTTLAVFPVLRGEATLRQLSRLWAIIYVSNLTGAVIFALFAVELGLRLGVVDLSAFEVISQELVRHRPLTILLSAIAAGWLMGLLSWLATAAQDTLSRMVVVWLITFVMGFAGLHHSIVGSVEVLSGVFSDTATTAADYGHFLLWTTLGNTLGGVTLAAVVKYSHAVRAS